LSDKNKIKVALVGNPNSGKSTVYNRLTGLNQKVGNYPGVTVDKKTGMVKSNPKIEVTDLPGLYSLSLKSPDESIVVKHLLEEELDAIVYVADTSNLKRSLLLFSQIADLDIPCILVLNMSDKLLKQHIDLDKEAIANYFDVPVIVTSAKKNQGINELKKCIVNGEARKPQHFLCDTYKANPSLQKLKVEMQVEDEYRAWLYVQNADFFEDERPIENIDEYNIVSVQSDTLQRAKIIESLVEEALIKDESLPIQSRTDKLDQILTHNIWGYVIFFGVLFFIFQAIYNWATVPMDWIDQGMGSLSALVKNQLPESILTNLLAEGIIPGLSGILIFIPQIALLFLFLSILEQSGYLARVVFLMDNAMRKFGLSGKSVVPLMSGVACAIPAIMATRNISSWKERLITILVTPFMTCAARLPVYAIIIALVIPKTASFGWFNMQGITLMALYLFGLVMALISAVVLKQFIKTKEKGYLIMEMPHYSLPNLKDLGLNILEKVKTFVWEAGKVIFAISIILWVMASYGPGQKIKNAENTISAQYAGQQLSEKELNNKISAYKLENSWAGHMGKAIEPAIKPLGYDWKIGIALITSFAAREVFVGTIATIYSVGEDFEDESTIKKRMRAEINPETGGPRFTRAVAFSLLIFYALALQCMSTLAIVKRETKSWGWTIFQFVFMTALAYIFAMITYNILK